MLVKRLLFLWPALNRAAKISLNVNFSCYIIESPRPVFAARVRFLLADCIVGAREHILNLRPGTLFFDLRPYSYCPIRVWKGNLRPKTEKS